MLVDTSLSSELAARLTPLAASAWVLEPPESGYGPRDSLRWEAATLVDGLLARVARGSGALEVAIGQGLAALSVGDRLMALGYSGVGDYARERLGIGASVARGMVSLASGLRSRPLLWEAVRSGDVSARRASTVLPVARGDAEAAWVERARGETVRALTAAVREVGGAAGGDGTADTGDESWERFGVVLSSEGRAVFDEAMAIAGKILGAGAPRWQRLEVMCQELLGALAEPEEPSGFVGAGSCLDPLGPGRRGWMEPIREAVELETERWAFLERVNPVAAPLGAGVDGETDPLRLDASLRELAAARARWDEVLGHLAMLLQSLGFWRDLGFADLEQYCDERLGMGVRAFRQRAWLARRLYALPELREAMRSGRLSYEKARLVAGVATGGDRVGGRGDGLGGSAGDLAEWIDRAEGMTCIALRRLIDRLEALADSSLSPRERGEGRGEGDSEKADVCAAEVVPAADVCASEVVIRVPESTAALVDAAFRAVRSVASSWLNPGECLEAIARHFVSQWEDQIREKNTVRRRAMDRDHRLCTVPGCSRAAVHAHHVAYRSRGGGDHEANLTALCAAHHLRGVHGGLVRVSGTAPGGLAWQLAAPPV